MQMAESSQKTVGQNSFLRQHRFFPASKICCFSISKSNVLSLSLVITFPSPFFSCLAKRSSFLLFYFPLYPLRTGLVFFYVYLLFISISKRSVFSCQLTSLSIHFEEIWLFFLVYFPLYRSILKRYRFSFQFTLL